MTSEPCQVLFDFDQPDSAQEWQPVDDVVMGGRSASHFEIVQPSVAAFAGTVSLENGGGFASVRTRPERVDLSLASGLEVRARGDGRSYRVRLRTDRFFDGVSYEATFTAQPGDWQELQFPWPEFRASFRGNLQPDAAPLDPSSIYSFGFLIADRQAGPFRLDIDWLRAYCVRR